MSDREYKYFMMMSERCTGNEEKVQTATLQYPEFDSSNKRAEFNRKRLTIKTKTTSSASGSAVELFDTGIYVGGAKVSENAEWIPYRGFSTISVVEFLQVSGNEREAEAIRKASIWEPMMDDYSGIDNFMNNIGVGALIAALLGLFGSGFYDFVLDNDETSMKMFEIFIYGTVVGCLVIWLYPFPQKEERTKRYDAYSQSQPLTKVGYTNIFPITQAVQMAEGYNRQLWREMTNR